MQNGIDFEDMVTSIINGRGDPGHNPWYAAAEKRSLDGAPGASSQYKAKKIVEVGGVSLLLYGRLDCLKAGRSSTSKFL